MTAHRLGIISLALSASLLLAIPSSAQEAGVATNATYIFGESIYLAVEIDHTALIARAALFIRPESSETVRVELAAIDEDGAKSASIEIDPRDIGIYAFESLLYWWQIDLDSGETFTTEPDQLLYSDDRFDWETLSQDSLTLYWHERPVSDGQGILEIAVSALDQIARSFALGQMSPIRLIIYNNSQELQSSLSLAGIPRTGGHAASGLNLVMVSAVSGAEGLVDLERLIPHEFVHLLLDQRGPIEDVIYPAWLSEGMATMIEGAPTSLRRTILEQALRSDDVLRFVDLCTSFPFQSEQTQLAYAQSGAFVRYLIDVYGVGGIHQLLDAYTEGASCTGGIQRVYQRSLDQLQSEWQIVERGGSTSVLSGWGMPALAAALVIVASVAAWLWRRRRSPARRRVQGGP